jgi:hypothetical protein
MARHEGRWTKHDVLGEDAMEPQVAPLHAILKLNTDLLLNCLDGLSSRRPSSSSRGAATRSPFSPRI